MIEQVSQLLRRLYERKPVLPKGDTHKLPEAARVQNQMSNRATFASCAVRRRGYLVHVLASEMAELAENKLSYEREQMMLNAWFKGVVWPVPIVRGKFENDGFIVHDGRDLDIAVFLNGRQRMLVVQVLEVEDTPATQAKLHALRGGLTKRKGGKCSILFARITL
mgnify:CR=1 FL=1